MFIRHERRFLDRSLLHFQATEGSVEKLIAALVEIKREDAAKLVDEVKKQKEVARFVYGKRMFI